MRYHADCRLWNSLGRQTFIKPTNNTDAPATPSHQGADALNYLTEVSGVGCSLCVCPSMSWFIQIWAIISCDAYVRASRKDRPSDLARLSPPCGILHNHKQMRIKKQCTMTLGRALEPDLSTAVLWPDNGYPKADSITARSQWLEYELTPDTYELHSIRPWGVDKYYNRWDMFQ